MSAITSSVTVSTTNFKPVITHDSNRNVTVTIALGGQVDGEVILQLTKDEVKAFAKDILSHVGVTLNLTPPRK